MNHEAYMAVYAIVSMEADSLDDDELRAMNLCVAMSSDARGRLGYDKIQSLFTMDEGARMEQLTRECFQRYAADRLQPTTHARSS